MNRFALLGVVAVCASGVAQSSKVDVELPATSLERAIVRLAEATEMRLEVAPALQREIVVIRAAGVGVDELLERLAVAVDGTWIDAPDGARRLIPRPRPAGAALRARAQGIRVAIDRQRQLGSDAAKGNEGAASERGSSPGAELERKNRLMFELAATIDPMRLVDLGPYGRVVFSTRPTRMQRPLGGPATHKVLAEWVRAHNAAVELSERAKKDDETRAKSAEEIAAEEAMAQFTNLFGLRGPGKRIEGEFKFNLVVREGASMFAGPDVQPGMITIEAQAYDAAGTLLANDSITLYNPRPSETERKREESEPIEGSPIVLSPLANEFVKLLDFSDAQSFFERAPSPELAERMTRPDLHDPLSFAHSEALIATAKAHDLSLVACLPDSVTASLDFARPGSGATSQAVIDMVNRDESLMSRREERWWTITPSDPDAARSRRMDRAALAALIRASLPRQATALDDIAAYAVKNDLPALGSIAMPYVVTFAGEALRHAETENQWLMTRLYGMLGPANRQALAQGGKIPLSALGPDALECVRRMTYGVSQRLEVRREGASEPEGLAALFADFVPSAGTDYLSEPTEAVPDGVPVDAVIELTTTNESVIVPLNEQGKAMRLFGAISARDYAMLRAAAEMSAEPIGLFKLAKLGEQSRSVMRVRLTPQVSLRAELRDPRIADDASKVDVARLPAEFVKEVDKILKLIKDSRFLPGAPPSSPP